MTGFVFDTDERIHVSYLFAIDASLFATTDFRVFPSATDCASITQLDTNTLEIDFGFDITGEATFEYQGAVPGVLNPQALPI